MKKAENRILGLLLAMLMIVQVPYSVLAEDLETGLMEVASYETEASYNAEGIAEKETAVEDTTTEEEFTEDLSASQDSDLYEEDLTEEADILLEETESEIGEQILEEETEDLLDLTTPAALASEIDTVTDEENTTIQVTVSISKDGYFLNDKDGTVMADREITLSGQSSYTMDDALKAAHDRYYLGGSEAGYDYHADESGTYKGLIYKLWGYNRSEVSYIKSSNNLDCADYIDALSRPVVDGDELHFYIQQRKKEDMLAFFTEKHKTVSEGKEFTLKLRQVNDYGKNASDCAGATIYIDGVKQENCVTDENGNVVISGLTARNTPYFITAEKKVQTSDGQQYTAITAVSAYITVVQGTEETGNYLNKVTIYTENTTEGKSGSYSLDLTSENLELVLPTETVFNPYRWTNYMNVEWSEDMPTDCKVYAVYESPKNGTVQRILLQSGKRSVLPNMFYTNPVRTIRLEVQRGGTVVESKEISLRYRGHLYELTVKNSLGYTLDIGYQDNLQDQNLEFSVAENAQYLTFTVQSLYGYATVSCDDESALEGSIGWAKLNLDWSNHDQYVLTIAIDETRGGTESQKSDEIANYTLTILKGEKDYIPDVSIAADKENTNSLYEGTDPVTLTADVQVDRLEEGKVSYQWYYIQTPFPQGVYVPQNVKKEDYIEIPNATQKSVTVSTEQPWNTRYYTCVATFEIDNKTFSATSNFVDVTVLKKNIETPEIIKQPESAVYEDGKAFDITLEIEAETPPWTRLTTVYQWYQAKDANDYEGTAIAGATKSSYVPEIPEDDSDYYYCAVRYRRIVNGEEECGEYAYSDIVSVTKVSEALPWEGKGSSESPYLIKTLTDLEALRDKVNEEGFAFDGLHFKMTANITLPSDWVPIGAIEKGKNDSGKGKYLWAFSGIFDGGGHTLTMATGGKPLLNFVRNAVVENLNLSGNQIDGYGLVNGYTVDYGVDGNYNTGCPAAITIRNVTLKSGMSTKQAGLIGGMASGANTVTIENCTAERGVVIGYTGQESAIGTFAGSINGTIRNCHSGATVKGTSRVGGIAGGKGQAMGLCSIENCSFTGTVSASGNWAGGILGSGYEADSAPNTPVASVKNCYVAGTVSGAANVGGIFGGEPSCKQCWGNGSGSITNNFFYGTVSGNSNVGAIVGYLRSFDKFQDISNNYFLDTCGASKGIGTIEVILTLPGVAQDLPSEKDSSYGIDYTFDQTKYCFSKTTAEFADGTVTAGLNSGDYQNWTQGSSYPVYGQGAYATSLSLTGDYKKEYYIGEELDLSGGTFTVTWSDGTKTHPEASEITAIGYDANTQGSQMLTLKYGAVETTITVGVLLPSGQIEISFTLLGDYEHDSDADQNYHTLANNNLETWVPETKMVVSNNATVKDVLEEVLTANGMTWVNKNGNYVSAITRKGVKMAEFTNGKKSGWMYTLNGKHPNVAINAQYLKNGDILVFHYTDDFVHESHDHQWSGSWSSNGVVHWHACEWGCGQTKDQASHTWGSWKTTTKATVFAPAIQTRSCSVCGWKETRNTGNKLTPVLTLPGKLTSFNMKKNQSVSFGITMANGDSIASVTSGNSKILKVVSVNKKNGKITLKGLKTGSTKLTIKLASKKSVTYKVKVVSSAVKTTAVSVTNVTNKKLTLAKGKSYALKTERKPFTSTQTVTYASSNKKVVAVNGKGVLTAKKAGTAKITVKSGSKKVVVTVTVPQTKTTALSVTSSVTVKKGKTYTLKVKKTPANSDQKIIYASANKKIATVTSAGKIKGVKKGTTTITVKSGSITKKVKVTVK